MKKNRRNPSPAFKAKVALEAAEKERTIAVLSREYGVHPNQIRALKPQPFDGAVDMFESDMDKTRDQDAIVRELHAKIGELTMERDFLSGKRRR